MMIQRNMFVCFVMMLLTISACSVGVRDKNLPSMIESTAGATLTEGMVPAVFWEIDGERVSRSANRYTLAPGPHTIRVLATRYVGSTSTAISDLDPDLAGKRLVPLTVNMQPGVRYRVAAREVRFRTGILAGDAGPAEHSPWRIAIIPVLVEDDGSGVLIAAAVSAD